MKKDIYAKYYPEVIQYQCDLIYKKYCKHKSYDDHGVS